MPLYNCVAAISSHEYADHTTQIVISDADSGEIIQVIGFLYNGIIYR
ncbi:MAG: hypothetical protein FWD71_07080 [Oscillospiraceae bacterium]|nr:hypothetical protein [Oscillospiraceae bacterium]